MSPSGGRLGNSGKEGGKRNPGLVIGSGGDTGCSKALAGTSIIRRTRRGTSGCVVSDAESILRGETLRLSHLVEKKDTEIVRPRALLTAERERHRENEAIIEALADSHESNREQDMSEVMRIRLEIDLLTLQAEVDRLRTSERLVASATERLQRELLLWHRLTSYVPGLGALRPLCRAVLSLLLFIHL
ncbi:hypothetical protein AAC387_Pa02g2178 [Persea americana]